MDALRYGVLCCLGCNTEWGSGTLWLVFNFSTKLIIYGSKLIAHNKIDPGTKTILFLIAEL